MADSGYQLLGKFLKINYSPKKRASNSSNSSLSDNNPIKKIPYSEMSLDILKNLIGVDFNELVPYSKEIDKMLDYYQAPVELKNQLYSTYKMISKYSPLPGLNGYTEALPSMYIIRTLQDILIYFGSKNCTSSIYMMPEEKLDTYYSESDSNQNPKYFVNGKLDCFIKKGDKLLVFEIKYMEFQNGIYQLALQLKTASDKFNISTVYGILTTGFQFILLIFKDKKYQMSDIYPFLESSMFTKEDAQNKWLLNDSKLIDVVYSIIYHDIDLEPESKRVRK